MTATGTALLIPPAMIPYQRMGEIDYAGLDYNPDDPEPMPDAMEQEPVVQEMLGILNSRFTDFGWRPDVFLSSNTTLCYDPSNLNVRVQPDIYLAFGVDQGAIRPRLIYLPWEAGKPPDLALEVASPSTRWQDIIAKPRIYATIGIPEYWRFDPTGGEHHSQLLSGERLIDGAYQPIELTTEPDGILKGYSAILGLALCWDEGWPRFYDPATGTYLENWREERARLLAERDRFLAEQERFRFLAEQSRLQSRVQELEAELRRRPSES